MAQMIKRLPAMQETQVRSLSREDPLEKEVATHSNSLAWKIPWMEKPGRLQSMGSQRVSEERLHFHLPHKNKHLFNILFIENKHILFKVNHLLNLVFCSTTRYFFFGKVFNVRLQDGRNTDGWVDRSVVGRHR